MNQSVQITQEGVPISVIRVKNFNNRCQVEPGESVSFLNCCQNPSIIDVTDRNY